MDVSTPLRLPGSNRSHSFNMRLCLTYVLCLIIRVSLTQDEDAYLRFPEGFKIGAGGSAYQIEGSWNSSDKGESVWDRFVHTQPWKIADRSNGDIACDSYNKYKEDVQWVKEIGLDHYQFSISWSRVLPNGFANSISQEGLRYYHNLLDELKANKIEPIVTLYHWNHPQALEDLGGWMNESMASWFAQYADIIFRELGPKVKVFVTLNEPQINCLHGYGIGKHAPGKMLNTTGRYMCGHNALKAHAKAYRLYDRKYRPTQNGKIGIGSLCFGYLPKTPSDTFAAHVAFQFNCGWISHPIFVGDYPRVLKTRVAQSSKDAGFTESALPEFSPEWIEYIRGTYDFFGLNHYTSLLVEDIPPLTVSMMTIGSGITTSSDPSWERTSISWLHIVPEGLGRLLRQIKYEYNNPPVYIMENGLSDNGELDDHNRIKYHYLYLKELLLAVNRDGCNVQKYSFWSLLDNFQWESGYQNMFGLISVNFSSPNRERVPKLSVTWLKNVTRTRQLQPPILSPTNAAGEMNLENAESFA